MASVPTRYIFYGGIEGAHQLTESDLNGADYGAAAYGFVEGGPITGEVRFSGPAYELLEASYPQPPVTATWFPAGIEGLEIFLQYPHNGPAGLTEQHLAPGLDPDETLLIALPDDLKDPLLQLGFHLRRTEDGPDVDVDARYIRFSDDDDGMAEAYGVWMPENVKVDVRVGSDGADNIKGGKDWNFLYGLGGDDKLTVRDGENGWAWGGTGNDTIKGGDDGDHLFGGWGDDQISGKEGQDLIKGGLGDDTLDGGDEDDIVIGGVGNDTIKGGDGGDVLEGNDGSDTLNGGSGEDFLSGGEGDDSIEGGGGDDVLIGWWGDDTLRGGGGKDDFHIQEFHGNDVILNFQRGQDQIFITVSDPLDFQSLMATAVYENGDTTLTYFQGATITLVGLAPDQLSAGDFVFS